MASSTSNVTPISSQVKPFEMPDYNSALKQAMSTANMMALMYRRMYGGGGRGKGAWHYEIDPTAPNGFRRVWVEGGTDKERKAYLEAMRRGAAVKALQDPEVAKLRAGMENMSVHKQKQILDDIRRNHVERLSKQYQVPANDILQELGTADAQLDSQLKKINADSGFWNTLWDAASRESTKIADAITGVGEDARAEFERGKLRLEKYQQATEENAYLREQQLREQEGEGFLSRQTGPGSSFLGMMGSLIGGQAADTGAPLAGMGAGAAAGTATAGPVGAAVGGLIGAGAAGSQIEKINFIDRVVADPNLTDEQKIAAIEAGSGSAQLMGGALNALPLNLARVAAPVRNAVARAGIGRLGREFTEAGGGALGEQVLRNAAARRAENIANESWLRTYATRAVPQAAVETGLANVGTVVGQNAIFNEATGQDTPLSEGVGESVVASVLGAPFFGAFNVRSYPRRNNSGNTMGTRQTGTDASAAGTAAPNPGSVPPGDGGAASAVFNQSTYDRSFRSGLKEYFRKNRNFNPDDVQKAYTANGMSVDQYRAFVDTLEAEGFSKKVVDRLRESFVESPITNRERALYDFTSKITAETTPAEVDAALQAYFQAGGTPEMVERFLKDGSLTPKRRDKNTSLVDVNAKRLKNFQRAHINEGLLRNKQNGATVNGEASGNAGSGAEQAASFMGSDGQARTGSPDAANTASNSRVATDTGTPDAAPADSLAQEAARRGEPVEGGRTGGAAQPGERQNQTAEVLVEPAGTGRGTGADSGRSGEPAAAGSAQPDTGAGIRTGEGIGSAGVAGNAEGAGAQQQPAGRRIDLPDGATTDVRPAEVRPSSSNTPIDMTNATFDVVPKEVRERANVAPVTTSSKIDALPDEFWKKNYNARIKPENARNKAWELLISDRLNQLMPDAAKKFSKAETKLLNALHDSGIATPELPDSIWDTIYEAQSMTPDVSPIDIVKAELNSYESGYKVAENPAC